MQGMGFHDPNEGGELVAACWLKQGDDLFVVSEQGLAIRFSAHQLGGRRGRLGLRLEHGDRVLAIAATREDGGVLLLGADGRGSIRQMSGFRQNKAPGAGGKQALKSDKLVGAVAISPIDDVFVISAQSKIIRFTAAEIPPKAGVVQGVNCMALRSDEVTALTACAMPADV
jgi:DNA gyrase subunit A